MKKYQILLSGMIAFAVIITGQVVSRAAEVIFVEGSVQVQSPQESAWRKVEQGMRLSVGDMIRTARHSMADIALDAEKKNTVRIDPKTQVVLNSATADTFDRLDVSKGRIYANLESIKAGLSFEVNTPSAVAGVRGSSYSVYVERDQDEVMAIKDTVFIKAFDVDKKEISEIMLPEGFKTFIERFSEPSAFAQISSREFRGADRVFQGISNRIEGKDGQSGEGANVKGTGETELPLDGIADQEKVIDEVSDTKVIVQDQNADARIEEDPYMP
jgi:hypothetical protein